MPKDPNEPSILLRWWDVRTAHVLFTILIVVLGLGFVVRASDTLVLFLFATLFAYFLAPMVGRLEGPVKGRGRAIAIVYLAFFCIVIGLLLWAGPKIEDEASVLNQRLPEMMQSATSGQALSDFASAHGISPERVGKVRDLIVSHKEDLYKWAQSLGAKLAGPLSHIYWLLLIPILSLFLLKDAYGIKDGLVGIAKSEPDQRQLEHLLDSVNKVVGSYIRAQIVLAAITFVGFTLFLSIVGVPYSFALAALAGIAEFVPVVGPVAASVTIFLICLLTGYAHPFWFVGFAAVFRLIQDYVVAPRVMGGSLELSPLASIFAVLAGAEIAGVVGALIAVPTVAVLRSFWTEIRRPEAVA